MFRKKKQINTNVTQICNIDKNLTECNLVSQIRDLQERLKFTEAIDIYSIAKKYARYTNDDFINSSYKQSYYTFASYINYILQRNTKSEIKQFIEELSGYINREQEISELKSMISDAKSKLGIS